MQNLIVNGINLPAGLAAAHNEVIGKADNATHIQQQDIGCLLIAGTLNCFTRYFYSFQTLYSHNSRLV